MPTETADRAGGLRSAERSADRSLRRFDTRVPALSFIAFRVAFGAIVALSSARFIARGWVDEFYVGPQHHLTYARFEWVRPLPGPWMYALMTLLALTGVAIATGRRYRIAAAVFAVGFAYTELIDAALYLNHYWFVTLAAMLLAVLPRPLHDGTVPAFAVWAIRAQLACVYVFAGVAKLNPDWLLEAQPLRIWLAARTDRPVVGPWLDEPFVAFLFSWAGAAFDLTIVGWLLWRRSRPVAYLAVIAFHVATAALFQIGVFPWVMIASTPIFFAPDWPRRLRLLMAPHADEPGDRSHTPTPVRPCSRGRMLALGALAVGNVVLPLRHLAADGNVRFNDDGYYLSWRVMLTERAAFVEYQVIDPATGHTRLVHAGDLLEPWQVAQADTRPDLILATAHLIADETERDNGARPIVHADAWVSVNGRPRQRWIDPAADLADLPRTSPAATYVLPFEPPVRT